MNNEKEAYIASEDFYKSIIDSSWDWEYLSNSFTHQILYMTPSVEYHTGYNVQEFLDDFFLLKRIVHKDDLQLWLEHIEEHKLTQDCIYHRHLEYRIITKDGKTKWLAHVCRPFFDCNGEYIGRRVSNRDITEQKEAQTALNDKNLRYQAALLDNIPELIWLKDKDGEYQACNPAFERYTGVSAKEIIGKTTHSLHQKDVATKMVELDVAAMQSKKSVKTELELTFADKTKILAEVTKSPIYDSDGAFIGLLGIARDVTDAKLNSKISETRTKLHKFAPYHTLQELLVTALDEVEELTGSAIGFCHFLEEDQESLMLQAWSTRTSSEFCHVQNTMEHYSLDAAGVWADCIRQRKAVIHNDYASLPNKKGMPEGHAEIVRQLVVPVFRADKIVAILGVGNKPTDYSEKDVEIVSKLADLAWDIAVQKKIEENLRLLAHFDTLTHLPNRVMLADRMKIAVSHAKRTGEILAVCVLDLDGFKPVNDTFGHKAGDIVLQEIAKRLLGCIRGDDTAARLGGDEFALLLGGLKSIQESEKAIERLLEEISLPIELKEGSARVSASIGVTFFPIDGADSDTLIRHADIAMYQAKQSGKSRYCFFDHAHEQKMKANQSALKKIKKGLENGEFCLFFQPKVNCREGIITGVEALIRWRHPVFGIIAPSQFLPLIEHDDIIVEMGDFVIKSALLQMKEWKNHGLNLPISVNIAAKQLRRLDFFDHLSSILDECEYDELGIPLEIEIVETAALEDVSIVSELIRKCKTIGVNFSLDDFGTGYSSLLHLKHLCVDTLKIDQAFTHDMLDDPDNLAITEGIIALSNAFDREVVAEGVESIEHVLMLLEIGCDVMQGYGVCRPMPADKVREWVDGFVCDPRWALASTSRPSRGDFHLLLAEANHRHWVDSVIAASQKCDIDHHATRLPPLQIGECRFGQWYYIDGKKRYGHYEDFAALEPLHESSHFYAREMLECAANNDLDGLVQNKDELLRISSRLTSKLHRLKNIVAKEKNLTKNRSKK